MLFYYYWVGIFFNIFNFQIVNLFEWCGANKNEY